MAITIKDIKDYYQLLQSKLKSDQPDFEYNKDRCHNSTVLRLMLDESKDIYMFCGELSVLRQPFYDYITESEGKQVSEMLVKSICDSFKSFVQDEDHQINIILESYNDDVFKDLICSESFFEGIDKSIIHIFSLSDKIDIKNELSHFSVSNRKIVRLEKDKIDHNALCSFNNDLIFDMAKNTFFKIKSMAKPIIDPVFELV